MFKKKPPMHFGVRINQEEDVLHIRCLLGEKHREPEALEHLNRVGSLIKSLETGFYEFEFKPVLGGLYWNYDWARLEEEPPQPS
jgi:hypothetical protein